MTSLEREALAEQRVRLIRWHNSVCPDGSTVRNAQWKSKLARLLEVSPATVTNLCSVEPSNGAAMRRSKTIETLGKVEAEAFNTVFGFGSSSDRPGDVAEAFQAHDLLSGIASKEDYADLCLAAGKPLRPDAREGAEARLKERKARLRDHSAQWRRADKAYWFQSISARDDGSLSRQVPMHNSEEVAIAAVARKLLDGPAKSSATIVHARPYSGVGYALQRSLADQLGIATSFRGGIHHLYLDALEPGVDAGQVLAQHVLPLDSPDSLQASTPNLPERLARYLSIHHQLLIIHGATSVSDEALIKRLSESLTAEAGNRIHLNLGVSRLLLTCWNRSDYSHINNGRARRVDYDPAIADETMSYFQETLQYYLDLRRSLPGAAKTPVDSSVTKLIERHYEDKQDPFTEVPAAVRFRAFCASDLGSPSPFDPTQGIWPRVDEHLGKLIPELTGCLADVQSNLRTYDRSGNAGELTTLRAISTGLFFFTQAMLGELQSHAVSGAHLVNASLDDADWERNYIHLEPISMSGGDRGYRATMPLLVRSLLQDDWMRSEPASHCAVHEALGQIFHKMAEQDDQQALAKELPYAPPRGRARIALALESIRHSMRAARTAALYLKNPARAEQITKRALDAYDRFLESGVFSPGTETASGPELPAKLSRTYGLHGLKYEVLCLLSEDGRGGRPPRGLAGAQAGAFFRELGITLTRMLRPADAVAAFMVARVTPGVSAEETAYVNAHAVMASLVLGDIDSARKFLGEARKAATNSNFDHDTRARITMRNDAREALIALADGEVEVAVAMWDSLSDPGLIPFWGDRSIGYLDAHLSGGSSKPIDPAVWRAAEQASNKARNDGLEHERLRVEIRRAAILRRQGYPGVAEAILDQVGLDLSRHGGDELAFREFQLASADTLLELGQPRYAFAAYAWPSFVWLRHGQGKPWAERARVTCLKLLDQVAAISGETLPDLEVHPFWKLNDSIDRSLAHPFFSVDLLPPIQLVKHVFSELGQEDMRGAYRSELIAGG